MGKTERVRSEASFDVVVVGGGIAGCIAAIEAARSGARVCLASAAGLYSGSSFFPGTWGLGLVAPSDARDVDDMVETVVRVGRGVANAALVESFVRGIPEAIELIERMGIELKRPANPTERQYIPCFDHKLRLWRGLERGPLKSSFGQALARGGVAILDECELLDISMDGSRVAGVLFFDRKSGRFRALSCSSLVLAGGGMAGLYERGLCSCGNFATMQALAARCGARLTNLEFMQIMPGLVSPRRNIVFNEKAFRFAVAYGLGGTAISGEVLAARSEYGPFSCERAGSSLDFAMEACGDKGMEIICDVNERSPEFVRTYSKWLERECGVEACAPARIAPYAHASNGGIAIDEHASCGVPGLYAAGECTGGMHGADRIGGLASANALVFGMRAGGQAARFALEGPVAGPAMFDHERKASAKVSESVRELRALMQENCMISRNAAGLARVLGKIALLADGLARLDASSCSDSEIAATMRFRLQLESASELVRAMAAREQSCGSHYRSDARS